MAVHNSEVLEFIAVEPKRPSCPRCGSKEVVSHGQDWACQSCRRRWIKNAEYCPHCGSVINSMSAR